MRMHSNYGGLLNRGQIAREEDQQDAPLVDETQTATDEVPSEEVPADGAPAEETPVDADAVAEVPAEVAETSAVEDGVAAGDESAANASVDAVMDADPATAEASGEIDGDTPLDVPAETIEDAVSETPAVDAETEAAVDAALDVAVNTVEETDAAGGVTEVESGAEFSAGTDEGADAAADAAATADVTDGLDATADAVAVEPEMDVDPATAEADETPELDVDPALAEDGEEELPGEEPAADVTTDEETPAEESPTEQVDDGLTSDEAVETVADATQAESEAEVPGADADVGTAEGGATGEAGLTEEVAVNDGETEEVAPIADPEPDPNITEEDSDMDGVADYDADVTDMNDEMDDVVDSAQDLEVAVESLRIAADNGGLDRNGAMFMNLTIQNIYKKVPTMGTKSQRMSMEAFNGVNMSKVDATQLAMEEAKSNLRKIVDQIIEMIRKGAEFIKEALKKYFDEASSLHAKAKNLLDVVRNTKGQPTVSEIQNQALVNRLYFPGKNSVDIAEVAKVMTTQAGRLLSNTEQQAAIAIANGFAQIIAEESSFDSLYTLLNGKNKQGNAVKADMVGVSDPGEGMVMTRGVPLPGNRAIIDVSPASKKASVEDMAKIKIRLGSYDTAAAPGKDILPVLTVEQASMAIEAVINVLRNVINYNGQLRAIDKAKGNIIAAVKQVTTDKEGFEAKHPDSQTKTMLSQNQAAALAKAAAGLVDQPAASFIPYALGVCRAMLEYSHKSLSAYGAAASKEATA